MLSVPKPSLYTYLHPNKQHTSLMCPLCIVLPVEEIPLEYTEEGSTMCPPLVGMLTPGAEVQGGGGCSGTM